MCVGLFLASIRRQRVSRTCFVVPFTQITHHHRFSLFRFADEESELMSSRSLFDLSQILPPLLFLSRSSLLPLPPPSSRRASSLGVGGSGRRPADDRRTPPDLKKREEKGKGGGGGLRGVSLLLSERCSDYPPRQRQRKERKSREKEAPLLLFPSLHV